MLYPALTPRRQGRSMAVDKGIQTALTLHAEHRSESPTPAVVLRHRLLRCRQKTSTKSEVQDGETDCRKPRLQWPSSRTSSRHAQQRTWLPAGIRRFEGIRPSQAIEFCDGVFDGSAAR